MCPEPGPADALEPPTAPDLPTAPDQSTAPDLPTAPDQSTAPVLPTAPALPTTPACLNCGTAVVQRFCPACGQETGHRLQRPLRQLVGEVLDETLALDSRFVQTVGPLFLRPGFLAAELLAGRKVSYTSPLKLYLIFSLLFFVAAALDPGASFREAPPAEPKATLQAKDAAADAGVAELRALGPIGARLADRVASLKALPPAEAQARADAVIQAYAPRAMFFLVPALALLLKLAWRRRFYAEHLVVALHAHAVGFAALLPGQVAGSGPLAEIGMLAGVAWMLLALRRLHGQGWVVTVAKGLPVMLLYAMLVGVSLALALATGLLLL